MNKKGFTLIELLAVIVIIALIAVIAVPMILGVINKARKGAMDDDARLILNTINREINVNPDFKPTDVAKGTIENMLHIKDDNYESIVVTMVGGKPKVVITGQGKFDDLTAYGTKDNLKVVNTDDYDVTPPVITLSGMNPLEVFRGDTFIDPGAVATDAHDGNVTSDIVITGTVDANTAGSYTRTYTVTDDNENTATTTRTVTVIIPTIAQKIAAYLTTKNGSNFYAGANPNNWIEFGQVSAGNTTPIMWRIIKSDADGVKIIYEGVKNGSSAPTANGTIGVTLWDTISSNKYERPASMYTFLSDWYSGFYAVNKVNYVQPIRWCIGGAAAIAQSIDTTITDLLAQECIDQSRAGGTFKGLTTGTSAIGLIRASDYISTSTDATCTKVFSTCNTNNFLDKSAYNYWTFTADANSVNWIWTPTSGYLSGNSASNNGSFNVRPVLNIKSTNLYLSGNGALATPYKME